MGNVVAADDALIHAMRESCGWLCSNEIFYNRGPQFQSCAVICVISLTKMNRI